MELSVAYDAQGKILAAIEIDPKSPVRPHIQMDNASVRNLAVPVEFRGKKLHEFLPNLRVDVAVHKLVARRPTE
jgi:hypothetical protein